MLGLTACNNESSSPVQIQTLSNRADMLSGGDALVEVVLPPGAAAGGLLVHHHGRLQPGPARPHAQHRSHRHRAAERAHTARKPLLQALHRGRDPG